MAHTDGDIQSVEDVKDEVREPGMFHVIFLNDNYTPMDFVVEILAKVFNKNQNDAINIMMKIHNEGQAIVGTYIEDVALTKSEITKKIARENKFPLQTRVEPA